ncbi:hypothetical protein CMK19_08195 [Candidatus Poribacteria bacterium]|nr:hypothetical protein [Candidatus Poribacteria bacterium]MEE2912037.1 hypothetical protein [Candidatus Poribacteria bacterium]|tara:strand:- start:254 stop:616 length:363 start_codon:yes stop_codon:yes gene_type:complete
MVEFGYLPDQIQQLANRQLTSRPIRFCALGGSQVFQPDFVVLTDSQLLVLTEQNMLSLYPFAIIRFDVNILEIRCISIEQTLWQKIIRQSQLKIETLQSTYFINGLNLVDARKITQLISL